MPRLRLSVVLGLILMLEATGLVLSQERALIVVSASPNGEVGQIVDANEIRIVFSEPMVDLGGPVLTPPAWLSIAPAYRANYYWSGTRTLIVTADPDTPLPFATRFTVRVEASARSAGGRTLAAPRVFSFATPTVRLVSAEWYRKNGRADSPAVIAVRFNQPVRPADALAHANLQYEPHRWVAPTISAAGRERLGRENAAGLARFDAKVQRTRLVTESTAAVPMILATAWDEKRFPRSPNVVVFETVEPPATDGWLRVGVDNRMPSADGPETAPAQSSIVRLEPTFFVQDRCTSGCAPGFSNIVFSRNVVNAAVQGALTIRDISTGSETPLKQADVAASSQFPSTYIALATLGYPSQPPASKWLMRLDENLPSVDGQVLGYPWTEIVENLHAAPYATWAGQVWEAANGTTLPFMSRNVTEATVWTAPMRPADILTRLLRFQGRLPQSLPDADPADRRLTSTPDVFEGHGVDLSKVFAPSRTGLVWAALSAKSALPNSVTVPNFDRAQPTLLQVTNLGLTMKEGPQSALIFVTRLDDAKPVAGANVSIYAAGGILWSGTTGADGVAIAPALKLRSPQNQWQLSYVVTAEKDGDVAWVGSDWTGDIHPSVDGHLVGDGRQARRPSRRDLLRPWNLHERRGSQSEGHVPQRHVFRDAVAAPRHEDFGDRHGQSREGNRSPGDAGEPVEQHGLVDPPSRRGGARELLGNRVSGVRRACARGSIPVAGGLRQLPGFRIQAAGLPRRSIDRDADARTGFDADGKYRGEVLVRRFCREATRPLVHRQVGRRARA